ncbi:MAG: GNAT family N-acetyltransferase [Chromatiaceae bacterium]|nr:GNAT family N-acetyltransferase [Chromatiaceae bacterium]MCP5443819.1 GNAT family N-acetyltransferase [Chromatiaceae bacterium]
MLAANKLAEIIDPMGPPAKQYLFKMGNYGFRLYDHGRDEEAVCKLCWNNALPGGRPFPLIPEAGAVSFGRIVTGAFAQYAGEYFYVVDDLSNKELVGYLTGAEGGAVQTKKGEVPWMQFRDTIAEQIAEKEFGELSFKLYLPMLGYLEGRKFLYTLSLGGRAVQFLLHAKFNNSKEMPKAPACPEYHFHVKQGHRGQGIGSKLIEHFLNQFPNKKKYRKICAQVTVCAGHKSLEYYTGLTWEGKQVWKVYDKRETAMYSALEKKTWGLGPIVENVSLVADKKRLLAYLTKTKSAVLTEAVANSI